MKTLKNIFEEFLLSQERTSADVPKVFLRLEPRRVTDRSLMLLVGC